ncbi:signal peptidase II [Cognatishimia sp. SS12]|uniref:signal peptidase II n=1 Tax=Cognatishimia sp. SS12 TaxID=2979465 RepID=UPI00232D81CE|nr:signal peptidase II [Cognatishimia sp. SS12]MDC0737967.1 signal peptidase II [Cognatishimia sp. SS12]
MKLVFWAGFWAFIVDQASKYLVVHGMNLQEVGRIEVLPPLLNLHMAWNTGINFGLMANSAEAARWILVAIALLISGFVYYWMLKDRPGRLGLIAGGMLIGGALGNVVDRLLYGAVADFLNMSCCGIDNPYAFNVADIAIFGGALGLAIWGGSKKQA